MAGDVDVRVADACRGDGVGPRGRLHVGRRACLQGHSLWRFDRRRQPLHAAAQARALDGRARGDRLCRPLAAGACRGATAGTGDGLGPGRHPAGRRGLPDAACLDARPRQRQAPGHGLAAWRRLLLRLGQLAALRQREPRAAQRRRGRRGQSPAQHLRPSRPVGARRALRAVGQCRHARSRRGARMGARPCRPLRRRSRQRHDLRPVGRRRKGLRPAHHAGGAAACSTRPSCRAAPACASPSASARRGSPMPS